MLSVRPLRAPLTAGAQAYFLDDTLDSDVVELLTPHAPALITHVREGDPRILDMIRAGAGLADEVGMEGAGWPELLLALDDSSNVIAMPSPRRDDFALHLWATADWAEKSTRDLDCQVKQLIFAPDGKSIYVAGGNGICYRVDATGKG